MVASRLRYFASSIAFFLALASTIEAHPVERDALPNIPRSYLSGGSGLSGYSVPLSDGKYRPFSSRTLKTSLLVEALQLRSLQGVGHLNVV